MIECVRGNLVTKQPHRAVIETHGVAFEVFLPFSTFRELPEPGQEVSLLCHLQWREDGPQLFGFLTDAERGLFRMLTQVNKVGPKMAVNIMSACSPEKLVELIVSEDSVGLTALKGVGPKIATRLIMELKDKVVRLGFGGTLEGAEAALSKPAIPGERDVREALENLGYTGREIDKAFRDIAGDLPPQADLHQVLEAVLRSFSR